MAILLNLYPGSYYDQCETLWRKNIFPALRFHENVEYHGTRQSRPTLYKFKTM